jgi:hypothetical protein
MQIFQRISFHYRLTIQSTSPTIILTPGIMFAALLLMKLTVTFRSKSAAVLLGAKTEYLYVQVSGW